ncbi:MULTISPECIES: GTP cyclohydrolase FolE2 [unclassified Halomonas]|uniref:GTP cyclohydrolase FolE2 n=1 Tax=unclassified Halomonas TaxID=2609666 RepID=UPI0009904A0A|nr:MULTISPECIES: GTP cyclohydrolase FolE2 [unclassified Halomonas]AQU83341.1 GTP cyclohydrolase [Halomonas sp. 'Soap Lake \
MTALTLPDIAQQPSHLPGTLSWVGMEGITLPVALAGSLVSAKASAGVSLEAAEARGIHMSRLYMALESLEHQALTQVSMQRVLGAFLDSHQGLSEHAYLTFSGEVLLKRDALISPLSGWKSYPFTLRGQLTPSGFQLELDVSVGYSSTCPCSAALARQLIQQAFAEDFDDIPLTKQSVIAWLGSEEGILATPHSQRSYAHCSVRLKENDDIPLAALIERIEKALGTALQTAVKRIDEQAFALANGQNLMFCEDAAKRLERTLRNMDAISGFQLKVVHAESLHAHDAVARCEWQW